MSAAVFSDGCAPAESVTCKWNKKLNSAKSVKNDEFYTKISDIEKELTHYTASLAGKSVYCNCDDPAASQFWRYFSDNFKMFGLSRLVSTHYVAGGCSYAAEITSVDAGLCYSERPLSGNGDFRSAECIEILKGVDIVVTNPPFSLFREYVDQLIEHEKQFLIVGNTSAIAYKEIFGLIKDNRLWLGVSPRKMWFYLDAERTTEKDVNACWFTNMPHSKRNETLVLRQKYDPAVYPKYDRYDAIEVGKVAAIPCDYTGVMGVPITFMERLNPNQFELVGFVSRPTIGCKAFYSRLLIRQRPN